MRYGLMAETKKVIKPWGYELWIASNDTGSKFAMKEIFINSGHKTSSYYKAFVDYFLVGWVSKSGTECN